MRHYFNLLFFAGLLSASASTIGYAQEKRVSPERLHEQAEAAHNSGKYQEALALLNQCLKENPNYTEAYFTRASTREQLKDLPGALTDYSIFLELQPNHPEAILNRGVVRYKLEKYEQAKEDFLKLLTLPPGETNTIYYQRSATPTGTRQFMTAQSAMKSLIYNYLGLTETKLKNYKAAISWLDSALQLESREADYYVNRGTAKEALDDPTALQDYEKALAINPSHTAALHNMAGLKKKLGDTSRMDDLEKAIESDSSMLQPYLERAYQRLEGKYYKGALEDYNKALQIEDKDPEIWLNRGFVKEKLNDLKGAYSDYTKAISLKEDYAKAWLNRGNVLNKQGKHKESIEDYTVALTYQPDYSSAFYNRAIAKQRLKLRAEACEDLKMAEALGMAVDPKMKEKICQ